MTSVQVTAILCVALLIAPTPTLLAWQQPTAGSQDQQKPLSEGQLDSLVAPLALYPDPILSQVLVASTYPLEIVEAARWVKQQGSLQGKALADAAAKQPWDASVQALVVLPEVLNRLNSDLTWTTDLGNAFLAEQDGVMAAIQRMRQKASDSGALQTTPQQTVSTTTDNGQSYIQIEPASPEVVYIPTYDPVAVWGPAPDYYPYPPIYYPSAGAIAAASAISFGVGVAVGAIWGNGWGGWHSWGWNAGWGRHNVVINNNFINNNHFNRVNVANGNNWVHNPSHRDGVPYNNRNVANRYGNMNGNNINNLNRNNINRPTAAQTQQRLDQMGGRGAQTGGANRLAPGRGGEAVGNMPGRGAGPAQGGANRMMPGGGDRIGDRQIGGGSHGGAFGGMNQGGMRTQMNSNRGFASHGGGFGGGGSRGGGGGFRGGGGGGRRR